MLQKSELGFHEHYRSNKHFYVGIGNPTMFLLHFSAKISIFLKNYEKSYHILKYKILNTYTFHSEPLCIIWFQICPWDVKILHFTFFNTVITVKENPMFYLIISPGNDTQKTKGTIFRISNLKLGDWSKINNNGL